MKDDNLPPVKPLTKLVLVLVLPVVVASLLSSKPTSSNFSSSGASRLFLRFVGRMKRAGRASRRESSDVRVVASECTGDLAEISCLWGVDMH